MSGEDQEKPQDGSTGRDAAAAPNTDDARVKERSRSVESGKKERKRNRSKKEKSSHREKKREKRHRSHSTSSSTSSGGKGKKSKKEKKSSRKKISSAFEEVDIQKLLGDHDKQKNQENNTQPKQSHTQTRHQKREPENSALPSADNFVPTLPANLMALALQPAPAAAQLTLETSRIPPRVERSTREARRAHISGFPSILTAEQLRDFLVNIMVVLRREKVIRDLREIYDKQISEGDSGATLREIPQNAEIDVDDIVDLTVNSKAKPFAFLEVKLADIITELVEACVHNPQMFRIPNGQGGISDVVVKRPRDYRDIYGTDPSKVVMMGFHPSLNVEKLRGVMEQFGKLEDFQVRGSMAYGAFSSVANAEECISELHGFTLGRRVLILSPLHDWLRVICINEGFDIPLDFASMDEGAGMTDSADAAKDSAPDHMRELLEMGIPLPKVIANLSQTYPHLKPLFGTAIPRFPTRVLVLLNMFDEQELIMDESYSHLLEDISQEVEKYGRVKELIVPRREAPPIPPKHPTIPSAAATARGAKGNGDSVATNPEPTAEEIFAEYEKNKEDFKAAQQKYNDRLLHPVFGGIGRVFVEYVTVDEAQEAQQAVAGKLFGQRTVITSFLFEDILHPPTAEEEEAAADASVFKYLKDVGADDSDEEELRNNTAQSPDDVESAAETDQRKSSALDDCD